MPRLETLTFEPVPSSHAKPALPSEKPDRREIPLIPDPVRTPVRVPERVPVPTEPVKIPSAPVPAR